MELAAQLGLLTHYRLGCKHKTHSSQILLSREIINPSNAETTFVQSTRMQHFLKNIQTLSCWYSLDSSRLVLSDEYPYARVSVIFQFFLHNFGLTKLATSSIRVKHDWMRESLWIF